MLALVELPIPMTIISTYLPCGRIDGIKTNICTRTIRPLDNPSIHRGLPLTTMSDECRAAAQPIQQRKTSSSVPSPFMGDETELPQPTVGSCKSLQWPGTIALINQRRKTIDPSISAKQPTDGINRHPPAITEPASQY